MNIQSSFVVRRRKDGVNGQSSFKSIVFKRSSSQPVKPTDGSYSSPVPVGWSDGVPAGVAQLWMTTRIFTNDGLIPQQATWTDVAAVTNTAGLEIYFCSAETPASNPTTNPDIWHVGGSSSDIWMATRTMTNGTWSDWSLLRIKGEKGDQGIQGVQGIQGDKGDQGIAGTNGADGRTTYFHIKYSDYADGANMNDTGGLYIGTYVDFNQTDSTEKTSYKWVLVKGAQGEKGDQGIAGTNGTDGSTSYLHIAYANSSDGSVGFSISDSTNKQYIGIYTDSIIDDSADFSKYTWTLIKGSDGKDGTNGTDGQDAITIEIGNQNILVNTIDSSIVTDTSTTVKVVKGSTYLLVGTGAAGTNTFKVVISAQQGFEGLNDAMNDTNAWILQWKDTLFDGDSSNIATLVLTITVNGVAYLRTLTVSRMDLYMPISRGLWSSSKTYTGNVYRRDYIQNSQGNYFIAKITAGTFQNTYEPGITTGWDTYWTATSFIEIIATGLLLAENANIANFIFHGSKMISQAGKINGVASTDYLNANFVPNIVLDGVSGLIKAFSGIIGNLTIAGNSLSSDNIKITEDEVEALNTLMVAYSGSYAQQSSWSADSTNSYAQASTQQMTVPDKAQLRFIIDYLNYTGPGDSVNLTEIVNAASGTVVYSKNTSGDSDCHICNVRLPAGTYYIRATQSSITADTETTVNIRGFEEMNTIYVGTFANSTKIGNNGFYSFWGKTQYLYWSSVYGFEVRIGSYGRRITYQNGEQKLSSGSWVAA